ncbi:MULTISPECIES: carboxylesterase [unclassified Rothia (in: high G+C Gram-positive bacteria)]|uniref:alpha/beta hydrolase n=1 Tax=unclassified Rothia (in: high G+C Gram-positive bacteria) TaxID=2689056 RepID=UPI001958264A|nr:MULTISPECIES: alpha/beta fold hydrolase [unclassified Rothia (in: high G+C Gram-positive bacteria)]MBM7050774.1 alpha/beta fold hydrolase [Rothia sp. ZJ1223]QRZ60951.1 alpha/beta fold hydrolase [Rothia sp. ZJ932]
MHIHSTLSHAGDSPVGVLVLHGFTGSPFSVRPAAEYFAGKNLHVEMPLLPGHGSSWQNMAETTYHNWVEEVDRAYWRLARRCSHVFVFGLSMGGTLALHLASRRAVAGIVVVNPFVQDTQLLMRWARWVAPFRASVNSIGSDIKKPGVNEHAYDSTPVKSIYELHKLGQEVRRNIASITAPILIFRSEDDHVIDSRSVSYLKNYAHNSKTVRLFNSFHVATLDYDAPQVFSESYEFIVELTTHHNNEAVSDENN